MAHHLFKVFKGSLGAFADIKSKLETFTDAEKVSARSIGIEFIEPTKEVIISLGYSREGSYAPVTIDVVNLGKVDLNDTTNIENLMSAAADKQQNVICHELCITDTKDLMMLFMSTR